MIFKMMVFFILLLFWVLSSPVFACGAGGSGTQGILQGLKKPDTVAIDGNEFYVMAGASIFVYSLDDLRLLRTFGKEGTGRGELRVPPEGANIIHISPGYLLAESHRKLIFFSKHGQVIKESPKSWKVTQVTPVGKNFVSKKYFHDTENNIQYMKIVLYNSDREEVKELYREKWFQQYLSKSKDRFRIELFSDYLNFEVCGDRIFVEKSPKGFLIDVYDSEGNKLYQIKKGYQKIKVTEADKVSAMTALRKDRKVELMIRLLGSWEKVRKSMKVVFPVFKPVIRNINIHDKKLYVWTFRQRGDRDECIVMDLKGSELQTVYLPVFKRPGVEEKMYDARYHAIKSGKLYSLKEGPTKGVWQLHAREIR